MNTPATVGFIGARWRGQASLNTLFWRDMLLVGSVINLLVSFGALMIAALGGNFFVAAVVHFACLPYNLFLVFALWQTPGCGPAMKWTSLAWLLAATVL